MVTESQSCSVLLEYLMYNSMVLRGSFYSPNGPRSYWSFIWKLLAFPIYVCTRLSDGTPDSVQYNGHQIVDWLPSFSWDTGQFGVPSDRWSLLMWLIVVGYLSHRTIWCSAPTIRWVIAKGARPNPSVTSSAIQSLDCLMHIRLSGGWHQTIWCCPN
jgi:hypothetical protein